MSRHTPPGTGFIQNNAPNRELRAIEQALRAGDTAAASRLAGQAAAKGSEDGVVLMLAAHDSLGRGAGSEALAYALKARKLRPHDPEVLNAYGLALTACGRPREALAVFDAALRHAPARPGIHFNKGCAFEALNDNARARLSHERAVELHPNYPQVLGRLAHLAAERGDMGAAREWGERALKLQPGEMVAALALAAVDIAEKKFEAALARLSPLTANTAAGINRAVALSLAGDAYDGFGMREDAFRAYTAANATRRLAFFKQYEGSGGRSAFQQVQELTGYFRAVADWHGELPHQPGRTHVFLVGFPRAGAGVLGRILAGHPGVQVMEDRFCLIDAEQEFLSGADGLDRLAALPEEDLEPWRQAYWTRAAEFGVVPTKPVFADKLPLNAVLLCLVAKLFPRAKIVFALRDPMDTVWSCFRRRFPMSLQSYEFLTLDGAARYYDAVMTLDEVYRGKLALDRHEFSYEALVRDPEGESRKLYVFLGLAPAAGGMSLQAAAPWTAYRDQLAPVLPVVAPWRSKFGYA